MAVAAAAAMRFALRRCAPLPFSFSARCLTSCCRAVQCSDLEIEDGDQTAASGEDSQEQAPAQEAPSSNTASPSDSYSTTFSGPSTTKSTLTEADFQKMRTKQLRTFLYKRGVECKVLCGVKG